VKQAVAFLNHVGRPDSDLASLGDRDAGSAKNFWNFYAGCSNVTRTEISKKFFVNRGGRPSFFKKAALFSVVDF